MNRRLLGQKNVELNNLRNSAKTAINSVFTKKQLQLTAAQNRLEALNPKSVLSRGYSITSNKKTGRVVTAAADVNIGDMLITELAGKNRIQSEVKTKTQNQENKNGKTKKRK